MASPLVFLLVGIKLLSLATCDEIDLKQMQSSLAQIGRQLMLQQLFLEERIRSDGDSGLKTIRLNNVGPRPYYAEGVSSLKKVNAFSMFTSILFSDKEVDHALCKLFNILFPRRLVKSASCIVNLPASLTSMGTLGTPSVIIIFKYAE